MVTGLAQVGNNLYIAPGIKRSAKDNLLKQLARYEARAGKGDQHPTPTNELERDPIDILIASAGPSNMTTRKREAGWV